MELPDAVLAGNSALNFVPPSATAPVDFSSQVNVVTSAFIYNRVTKQYTGSVTITNTGSTTVPAPVTIVLSSLSAGVVAVNASGSAPALGPSYNLRRPRDWPPVSLSRFRWFLQIRPMREFHL